MIKNSIETYWLFKKNPPKTINGRRIGICNACAWSGVLATTDKTEPRPTEAKLVRIIIPRNIKNLFADEYKFVIQYVIDIWIIVVIANKGIYYQRK